MGLRLKQQKMISPPLSSSPHNSILKVFLALAFWAFLLSIQALMALMQLSCASIYEKSFKSYFQSKKLPGSFFFFLLLLYPPTPFTFLEKAEIARLIMKWTPTTHSRG